jgi:hypothetical protein
MLKVRVNARGISQRRIHVLRRAMVLGCCRAVAGDGYGVRATRHTAARNTRCDGMMRRDSVLCLDRPPARIPHAGPGDGPTGARRFISPRAPSQTGHWDCHASLLGQSDAKRGRTAGRHEYRQCARFAQPTPPGCEVRAPPPRRRGPPARQPRPVPRPSRPPALIRCSGPASRSGAAPPPPPAARAPRCAGPPRAAPAPAPPAPTAVPRPAAP